MNLLGISGLMLFVISCTHQQANDGTSKTHPKSTPSLIRQKDILFETGFNTPSNFELYHFDSTEYICFGELRTKKQLVLCKPDGTPVQTVTLAPFLDSLKDNAIEISSYYMLARDTIALLSKYNNHLYIVDSSGNFIAHKYYADLLKAGFQLGYITGRDGRHVHITLNYWGRNLTGNRTLEELHQYTQEQMVAPRIMVDSNVLSTSAGYSLQIDSFYYRFANKENLIGEGNHLAYVGDSYVTFSAYSDSLYLYDRNFHPTRVVPVMSDYTRACLKLITHTTHLENPDVFTTNSWASGLIVRVLYNPSDKNTYCLVRHKVDPGKPTGFSMVVFDKTMNRMDEVLIDPTKYDPFGLVTSAGILLSNHPEHRRSKNFHLTTALTLFRYE